MIGLFPGEVIVLFGEPGAGKSRFARAWARERRSMYLDADGTGLRGPDSPTLWVRSDSPQAALALATTLLGERLVDLVVLDPIHALVEGRDVAFALVPLVKAARSSGGSVIIVDMPSDIEAGPRSGPALVRLASRVLEVRRGALIQRRPRPEGLRAGGGADAVSHP